MGNLRRGALKGRVLKPPPHQGMEWKEWPPFHKFKNPMGKFF